MRDDYHSHSLIMSSDTAPDPDQEILPDKRASTAERPTALTDDSDRMSADTTAQNLGVIYHASIKPPSWMGMVEKAKKNPNINVNSGDLASLSVPHVYV